jgi:hypothetical protein
MAGKAVVYASDAEVASIANRLLDRTLPKSEWTHAAHCVATVYLMKKRPDIDLARALPTIIRRYNETTGTPNSDSSGYHETITRFYLRAISHFLARLPKDVSVLEACNRFLASPFGARTFPLDFYSKDRLFAVKARHSCVEPNLRPLYFATVPI